MNSDSRAIRALIEAYADAVFRRDAEAWQANWHEDARWDLMGTLIEGRTAIVAAWQQAMAGFAFVGFMCQPGPIEVVGDAASARVWVRETLVDTDGRRRELFGRYDDEYRRTAEGWKIARRSYRIIQEL